MRNFTSFIIILFCLGLANDSKGQELKLYQWKSLQCVRSGYDVAATDNYIVYNTGVNLMFLDKSDYTNISYMTKIDGLTETEIEKIAYNEVAKKLFVYYKSGSIDIVDSDRKVTNLQDIKNNSTLVPDKSIRKLVSLERYVYLCMSFGLVQFDMVDEVFTNTVAVQGGVNDITQSGNQLYITTGQKLLTVNKNQTNISFIGNWTVLEENLRSFNALANWKNSIYVTSENNLLKLEVDQTLHQEANFTDISTINYLKNNADYLFISGDCKSDCLKRAILLDINLNNKPIDQSLINDNLNAVFSENEIWLADSYHTFRYLNLNDLSSHVINLNENSPWSNLVFDIKYTEEALYIASGGFSRIFLGLGNKEGLFKYDFTGWYVSNLYTDPFYANPEVIEDITTVDFNADKNELAIASMHNGLIINDGTNKKLYNSQNSPLIGITGDENTERVADVQYDTEGYLWMAMHSKKPVAVYTPQKQIYNFEAPQNIVALIKLAIDPNQKYKWFTAPDNNSVVVYDAGENIPSASDDRWAVLPVYSEYEKSFLSPTSIFADRSGRIWVGTTSGVFTIDCGSAVFESCLPRYPLVQDGSGLTPLLNGSEITAIAEDGAGRKWFGTKQGIFVTNEYGDEVLQHITAENSPLAANQITTLEIDVKKGNVYIGTTSGAQVYRTDASVGNAFHNKELIIYPNPVRPDYTGAIVIQGVANASDVKISDQNGRLVYETQSLGGQAIWDGRDFQKRKVASGVYYVLATSTGDLENPTGVVGKIVFIK